MFENILGNDKNKEALINSVKGQTEDGLIFCGSNVSRIKEIVSVKDLMKELVCDF